MSAPRPYVTEPFRPLNSISNWQHFLYIQQHSIYFLHVVRSSVYCGGAYLKIAHALLQKHSYFWFRAIISLVCFHMVRVCAYWHKIHDIHACAFAVQTKQSVISFGFLFRRLFCRNCNTFNINAEKPKSYSSTVVYFTLADLLETKNVQEVKFRDCH